MQKITKQIFCMILSVCMLILMIPGTSYATEVVMPDEVNTENTKNAEITENTEAVLSVISEDTEGVMATVPGDTEEDSGNLTEELTMDRLLADEKRVSAASANAGMYSSVNNEIKQDGTRYTVLALDVSGSMSGTPAQIAKEAAIKFCDSVMKADGKNYVAIIAYSTQSSMICGFTDDVEKMTAAINSNYNYYWNGTNTERALSNAGELLSEITAPGAVKNIVLLSDGLPEHGNVKEEGRYTRQDHYCYGQANAAYDTATVLKGNSYIYTLGFFHSLSGTNKIFGSRFMNDLQNAGYYEVINAEDLEFTFGEIADDISNVKKSNSFTYASGSADYKGTYFYDETYFTKSAYEYNASLSTMSICLAMSAFGSNETRTVEDKINHGSDYSRYSQNVEALLNDTGFKNIQTNEYYNIKPELDTIGAIAGQKKIQVNGKTYTLIAVGVRGGGYESEWGSNFTIGTEGEHQGFHDAKEKVLDFLGKYVAAQEITGDIKIWITGYSRAAATTNLAAAALDRDAAAYLGTNISLIPENIYAYCFETPQGALTSEAEAGKELYKNIHSIINPNDLVPKVAMSGLGFTHYGNKIILPARENDGKKFETKK